MRETIMLLRGTLVFTPLAAMDEELASKSPSDREAEMKRHLGNRFAPYTNHSERVRLREDRSGNGRADQATDFAEGFNTPLDGLAAGILARRGQVCYANIPNLWLLHDQDRDGRAESLKSLH